MKLPRLLLSVLITALAASALRAQSSFDLIVIGKNRNFVKNAATGPVPDTSNAFGNLEFWVTVTGPSFPGTLTGGNRPIVTLPGTSSYPTANPSVHDSGNLHFNDDDEWGYGNPDGQGIAMPNLTSLTTYFQHGTYAVGVLGNTVNLTLDMTSSPFPVVPNLLFSQGTWSNGTLNFDPNQDLTITVGNISGFKTGAGGTLSYAAGGVGGHMNLFLHDGTSAVLEQDYFSRVGPPGITFDENPTALSFTLSANPLNAGKDFWGEALFQSFLDHDTSFGYVGVSMVESLTSFHLQAVPEPSTYAMCAGLGALGLAGWRRRRTAP